MRFLLSNCLCFKSLRVIGVYINLHSRSFSARTTRVVKKYDATRDWNAKHYAIFTTRKDFMSIGSATNFPFNGLYFESQQRTQVELLTLATIHVLDRSVLSLQRNVRKIQRDVWIKCESLSCGKSSTRSLLHRRIISSLSETQQFSLFNRLCFKSLWCIQAELLTFTSMRVL